MVITKKEEKEIFAIEKKAKDRYIENSDWDSVVEMLDEDEKTRYNELLKKSGHDV